MKALIFNQAGEPGNVLSLADLSKPIPGIKEVLVKVIGSPIHPADTFFIRGTYRFKPEFPQIAGLEGAGIIEDIGSGVNLPLGALVAFDSRKAWADYVTVPEESVIVLPRDFPVEKAAQFYLNPFTAWGLLDESNAKAGGWLLLTAGGSTVSRIVIQLARLKNIRAIAVVRNLQIAEELKTLGAETVLKQDDAELSARINEITGGKGVDAAADAVGGKTGTQILQGMAVNGRVIIYGLLSADPVQFYNPTVIYKNLVIKGFGIRGYLQGQSHEQREEMIRTLTDIIAKPSFQLPVAQSFPLERFKEALEADGQGKRTGKIIFKN